MAGKRLKICLLATADLSAPTAPKAPGIVNAVYFFSKNLAA